MKNHIFSALSNKSFLYAWLGEIFGLIATNIFNFFLILVVYDITHSNSADAGVVLSITIPSIIFGIIAGAYVDRWDKKKVLFVVNISRALLLIILAFNVNNLYFLYIISFTFSLITQFFIPAELPILPLIVERKDLYSANALFGMAIYGSILLAYILAGPLIIFFGKFGATVLLAIMLCIASIFIIFIRLQYAKIRSVASSFGDTNIFKDLKLALSLISRTKDVFQNIFLLAMSQTLILVIATIAPGYAASVLGIPIVQFPLIFVAPAALGTVAGAWALINYFHDHNKNTIISAGIFLAAISISLLPFGSKVASKGFVQNLNLHIPSFLQIDILHIVIVLAFILGLANSLIYTPANTLLQEKTSEELRGKVYGFLNTFVGILSFLPVIIAGGLADLIGVGSVIWGIGVFLFIIGISRFIVK